MAHPTPPEADDRPQLPTQLLPAATVQMPGPVPLDAQEVPAAVTVWHAAPQATGPRPLPDGAVPRIPGYEILAELGRGGMGVVYKARHLALNRLVALKMILHAIHAHPEALARFQREAEAVARLRHPNIVQIYEVGAADGCPFLALELVEGGNLESQLDGVPQPPAEAARLVEALARAVHHAHQQGVVHRDLKPGNVLMSAACGFAFGGSDAVTTKPQAGLVPKITDFGLAKRVEADQSQTASEAILGTPTYMAPEQAAGNVRLVGPPADLYALGAIFYDLLTGRPPLRGTTAMDTLQMVLTREPVPPRRLQPGIPLDLQTICMKCLEKEPTRRYASAEHLAEDLHRFLAGEPVLARPTPAWERVWKWARRRPAEPLLIAACALALVGLVGGLAVYADRQRQLRLEAQRREENARQAEHAALLARREADARRTEAVRQQALLKQSNDRAEQARQRAQDHLLQAHKAVNHLIGVAQHRLPKEPHLEQMRKDLLETALGFCRRFHNQDRDNPAVQLQAAQTWRLVGDMQAAFARPSDAVTAYRTSQHLYEELLQSAPGTALYRTELARTLNRLARLHTAARRPAAALREREAALKAAEAALALEPGNAEARHELNVALDALLALANTGARPQALPAPEKGQVEALERLVVLRQKGLALVRADAKRPDRKEEEDLLRQELASTRLVLALAALRRRDHDVAGRALHDLAAAPNDAPRDWARYPHAAQLAAQCLRLIEEDRQLAAQEKRQRAERGAALVLSLLRRASERKGGAPARLFDNEAFKPLRGLAEFRRLRDRAR
jgi:tRNA A-37 threonylcarbamoyl transferase component Bud32